MRLMLETQSPSKAVYNLTAMPLNPGTRLGNYEVLAMVGAGGMGEVYRAHDSRLGRDVAIKTSAAQFTERFEREARAVAALNHPNICTLHDVGPNYLVMEYVDGESPKGPLPLDEALRIARQIANALDAAHEKGIVHRDLKPGNIKVKADGSVKVLDFGLAKTMAPGTGGLESADASHSPTISLAATQAGMILGTAAYMAPEQARGKSIDKRVDIWAFGVVLYELLTGERLFEGEDMTETLASVVKQQPDLTKVPQQVRKLLGKCLEKDPKKRLRDIGDVWELLAEPAPALPSTTTTSTARFRFAPWIVAAVLAAGLTAISWRHFRESPPPEHVLRYTIPGPEDVTILSFAVSPDGRNVAISGGISKRQLWLYPLNSLQGKPLASTEDATYPFWSPDSRNIGFFAQGKLKRIAVSGGPSQTIAAAPNGAGGSWNSDGTIVFAPSFNGNEMQRVQAAGGETSNVIKTTVPAAGPVFLPDGRHFLYTQVSRGQEEAGIYFASLDGKENRRILADLSTVIFVPSAGQKLFRTYFVQT